LLRIALNQPPDADEAGKESFIAPNPFPAISQNFANAFARLPAAPDEFFNLGALGATGATPSNC
jgi:hypothetical protein